MRVDVKAFNCDFVLFISGHAWSVQTSHKLMKFIARNCERAERQGYHQELVEVHLQLAAHS